MTYRKKLIETALPLDTINEASAAEKANPFLKGHPRQLHLWWARRPLAAARAMVFASLVDDPDNSDAPSEFVSACKELPKGKYSLLFDTPRMRLFDFISRLVQWDSNKDEKILETAKKLIYASTNNEPPPFLDPFAGGGSIPIEAQRLGLETYASDLNPIAVLINKALVEIPPYFMDMPPVNSRDRQAIDSSIGWEGMSGVIRDIKYYAEWIQQKADKRIGKYYPRHNDETVVAWIWARTVKSPNPGVNAFVPLVKSFELSKKKGKKKIWIEPSIDPVTQIVTYTVHEGKGKPPEGTVKQRQISCLISGVPITHEYVREEGKAGRLGYQLLAIVTEGNRTKNYYAPTFQQENLALSVPRNWAPEVDLVYNPRHISPPLYGLTGHSDLYSPRQLLALSTFSDLIKECYGQILEDARPYFAHPEEYANAISVYLSIALSRWVDYISTICTWNPTNENLRNVFARQALSITWDFAEANVFGSKLSYLVACDWVATALDGLYNSGSSGHVTQANAASLDTPSYSLISTDPPYYDNVPYADLSDVFYVWIRPTIKRIYPNEFGTLLVPKDAEIVADTQRAGSKDAANKHFEEGLKKSFTEMRKLINPNFPLSIYYAFKQLDEDSTSTGWETMLEGLIGAGFTINGTWPISTERDARTRSIDSNALASSIVLVCRPRPEDSPTISRRQFVDMLRRELPAALQEMQSGNIAPVDLAQASIGPGMAIYSRYSKVLEADGSAMSVRMALGLINQALDEYLAEQDGDIDADTRFAIAWFEQYGFGEGEFGQADVLARAKNTSVAGVEAADVVRSGRGKVRLVNWKDYDPGAWNPQQDKRPTVWEATHHLIERLSTHGESATAALLNAMPHDMAAEARALAYRLYSVCERKGWAEHARDYNALVISWAGVGDEAARLREQRDSGAATEQLGFDF